MKKFIALAAMTIAMMFVGMDNAAAQNDNGLAGRAIAEFNQSCNYQGAVETNVNVVSACFAGGFITEVLIFPKINCNQVDCTLIRVGPIGKVTFGCENDVISVECIGTGN